MSTESELLPMDDTQARLESHDNTLSPDVPNREPVKRKASASEDRLSPKRIKHDDHFREATNELPRRDSLQSRRDSHGDSAGVDVDRRKLATQEEKKRGKRLFGGLLNTLSQTAGNTQHKRRLEIERRQQERIHKQSIEDGKVREEKRARITEIRKGEQIVFDEEVMRNKHTKMLAMAQYLRTKSRPQIYYLPWKLTEEQEDAIDTQIQQAKTTIEREVGAFDARKERQTNQGRKSPVPVEATVPLNDDSASEPKAMNAPEQLSRNQEMDNQEHHDHHNDESADVLEEAEEDTVIY